MRCPSCHSSAPAGATTCASCGARWSLAETDPLLGVVVDGRYRLDARIGSGGMGSVYRATQLAVDREVAVKVVNALALQDPATVKRFETEARIISQLRHPNTLKLIDFGKLPDERPYLVTELLHGHPLSERLAEGPLPPRPALEIIHQICDALAEAHARGIIHRDLKPENIFLEAHAAGRTAVRVLDFGIAKLGETNNTATGTVCGTPAYMSPEQAQGGAADARSDIYALGVLAYRCLVGRPPFVGEQPLAVLLKHIQEAPVPLSQALGPHAVPPEVEWLVMAMLAKDPAQRPAAALEVKAHIEHILARVPVAGAQLVAAVTPEPVTPLPLPAAPAPMSATPTSGTPVAAFVSDPATGPEPSLFWVVGIGLVALALCIVAGAFLWQQGEPIPVVEAIVAAPEPPVAPVAATEPADESESDAPPPLEVAPEDEAPANESPAAAPEPVKDKRPVDKRPRRRTKRRRAKPVEPPPGFLDFEVE